MKKKNNTKELRILMLIPNLDFGGAQRVFFEVSNFLASKYSVAECAFNFEEGHAYPSHQIMHSLDVSSGKNVWEKAMNFFRRCYRYKKIKRKELIDVSISHLEGANYVNVFSGGKSINIIVEHGSKLARDDKRIGLLGWVRKEILIPVLFRMADHIVVVSRGIEEELINHFRISSKKISVINNAFNISRIGHLSGEPLSTEAGIFSQPVIIASGRLVAEKNLFPLLDILAMIKKQTPCRLLLLGQGELKDDLIAYAQHLGLRASNRPSENSPYPDADLYLLGYQPNPFKFLSQATLFVLPSTREGFPLSLCEAMICGAPVLASDCSTGPREILAPGTSGSYNLINPEKSEYGILMPLLTQTTLAIWIDQILNLLNDENARNNYRVNGRRRMLDFDSEKIMNQWIEVIEREIK